MFQPRPNCLRYCPCLDTRVLPLSSIGGQAQSPATGAADADGATKHTINGIRAYKHVGLKDIARISILLFPCSINRSDAAQQLTRLVTFSASDILVRCDEDSHKGIHPTEWVPFCVYPLQKSFQRAIMPDKPTTDFLTALRDDVFGQVLRALASGATAPAAFALLLRLLSSSFDSADTRECDVKLHNVSVSSMLF